MDELGLVAKYYTLLEKSASLDLQGSVPFAIVLSLPQRRRENETMRQVRFESLTQHCETNRGVDELHETPHNLASLLLTNTTICRWAERLAANAEGQNSLTINSR
jgi:hypothetical protein